MIWLILPLSTAWAQADFVRIKPGADLYAAHDLASGARGGSWMPWNSWREHCRTTGARAERLLEQDGVTALKIDIRNSGCGYLFRTFDEDYEKVFVRSDQLEPDGDEQTEAGVRQPNCPECGEPRDPLDALSKVSLAAMAQSKFVKQRQPEKTPDELESYMSCYVDEKQDDYQRLYRPLIDLIGRTAQVTYQPATKRVAAVRSPERLQDTLEHEKGVFWLFAKPSALECVTLRESRFDPAARGGVTSSGQFALGLGQQMPIAVKHMACALNGCELNGRRVGAKPWVRDVWTNIHRAARAELPPAVYKELTTNAVTGRPCLATMEQQVRDAACPLNSLATLAIAQIEGALTVRRADGRHDDEANADYGGRELFDLTVVTASTNNAGPGTTKEAVASTADTSQWARALATVSASSEVQSNTQALVSCLQAGNFRPPWTMKPGEKPRDCTRLKSARAE